MLVLERTAPKTRQRMELKDRIFKEGFAPKTWALDKVVNALERGEEINDGPFPTKKDSQRRYGREEKSAISVKIEVRPTNHLSF